MGNQYGFKRYTIEQKKLPQKMSENRSYLAIFIKI